MIAAESTTTIVGVDPNQSMLASVIMQGDGHVAIATCERNSVSFNDIQTWDEARRNK